jgi:hypothetical protein
MKANQNTTNINGKDTMPTEKLIICEIVFCGLATRSVNIVIEMPIAENRFITERLPTEINITCNLKTETF